MYSEGLSDMFSISSEIGTKQIAKFRKLNIVKTVYKLINQNVSEPCINGYTKSNQSSSVSNWVNNTLCLFTQRLTF